MAIATVLAMGAPSVGTVGAGRGSSLAACRSSRPEWVVVGKVDTASLLLVVPLQAWQLFCLVRAFRNACITRPVKWAFQVLVRIDRSRDPVQNALVLFTIHYRKSVQGKYLEIKENFGKSLSRTAKLVLQGKYLEFSHFKENV